MAMSTEPRWLTEEQTRTWLALWSVAEWLPTRLDEQLKKDHEVSFHDYFPLAQISMAPEEKLTMTELAALSDMSPSRLSHVVTRLENRGWVKREPSATDRRTNIASLTDAGRTFIQSAAPSHVNQVLKLVFDDLTPEENRLFGDLLNKVLANLNPPQLPRV